MFYAPVKIGPKRYKTPEGFLICLDVPIARIGDQTYRADEVPVKPRPGEDFVRILREPDEVFRPETIASANGKPFVVTHPDSKIVVPETFGSVSAGHTMNVRRGTGADEDVLLADLFIGRADAIANVEAGMREISMGYDCDYEQVGDPDCRDCAANLAVGADGPCDKHLGIGRQRNILFNHTAQVEEGRCGPRCAIGDCNSTEDEMTTDARPASSKRINTVLDALKRFVVTKDAGALEKELGEVRDEEEGGGHTIHIHNHAGGGADEPPPIEKRIGDLEAGMGEIKDSMAKVTDAVTKFIKGGARDANPDDDEEEKKKKAKEKAEADARARDADFGNEENKKILGELRMEAPPGTSDAKLTADSVPLADSFQTTIAAAEIIAPGIAVPTFDAKAKPGATFDGMCRLRRQALDLAYVQPATRSIIDQMLAGRTLDTKTMTCADTRTLFAGVAALKRHMNNADNTRGGTIDASTLRPTPGQVQTQADLNRVNADFWAKRTGQAAA